jgi:beta-mannosidase
MKPMKRSFILFFVLLHFIYAFASPERTEIKENWKFKMARMGNWYAAIVPGTVHTDLMNNSIIDDPFFSLNELAVQWVDKEDWIYETTFNLSPETLAKNNIRLFFKGLDTYADVYLNERKILETDNMFREWRTDIKPFVKEKGNKLRIYLHSPIKRSMEIHDISPIKYRASDASDLSYNGGVFSKKLSPYIRKASYHFGWDWGPRLVTSGIWRPIVLEAWNCVKIENVQVEQKNVSAKNADIQTTVEILSDENLPDAKIQVVDEFTNTVWGETTGHLEAGLNTVKMNFQLKNPRLWWTTGLGEQYLYSFKTQIVKNDSILDFQTGKIGIRSLRVIRQEDKSGLGLYFEINGVPVFAKGANFIPCDIFLPRVTKDIYLKTIQDAADVNMNMLRVWGGGIYEDDYFYELCDEYGILVWQDFMFACKTYPAQDKFMENIRLEAIDNVRRLRNHACLALWCGNNEIMDALYNWGNDGKGWLEEYRQQNNAEAAEIVWQQYYSLFHEVLPEIIAQNDPSTLYVPSSPYNDIKGTRSENSGDTHYWATWSNALPISTFNEVKSRFFSEYGFQSFPVFESVRKFAPNERDWDIASDVMMWHQRGGSKANQRIETCMNNEYGEPKDFEASLYLSQVLQGDAMKIAMESHRRNMPFCMGSLYWQMNDCWPVASWSSRDYYGRWKAQHYFARKVYDDVLITANEENGELVVYTVSDRLKNFKADLNVILITLYGKEVNRYKKTLTVQANVSTKSFSVNENELLRRYSKGDVVVRLELKEKSGKIYAGNYFLLRQKEMNFSPIEIYKTVTPIEGGFELSLSADKFARAVFVSVEDEKTEFSDNFIDILPHKTEKIILKTSLTKEKLLESLNIKSLVECIEKR